jgi:hypothetical protein
LGKNTIKSKHIKDGQVSSADVRDNDLIGTDIDDRPSSPTPTRAAGRSPPKQSAPTSTSVPRATTRGRWVALGVAVVALSAAVGLLVGKATDDDPEAPVPVAQTTAVTVAEEETALRRELDALGTTRAAQLRRLREARTSAGQASASRALASAYLQAADPGAPADSLSGLTPQITRPLAAALRRTAAAYRRLAAGAARDNRSTYKAGRRAIRRAEPVLIRQFRVSLDAAGTR